MVCMLGWGGGFLDCDPKFKTSEIPKAHIFFGRSCSWNVNLSPKLVKADSPIFSDVMWWGGVGGGVERKFCLNPMTFTIF